MLAAVFGARVAKTSIHFVQRRYEHLRVYDVMTGAAVSLADVVSKVPSQPMSSKDGATVTMLGYSLQSFQQVGHPRRLYCLCHAQAFQCCWH